MRYQPDISCELARIRIAERLDEAHRERLAASGRGRPERVPPPPARHPRRPRAVIQHGHAHGHT